MSRLASINSDAARPFFVMIDEDRDAEDADELIKKLFGSEDVVTSTKIFNCYRMNVDAIPDRTLRKKYAKKLPALYFYDAKGGEIGKILGKKSDKAVFSKLSKLYKSHYAKKSLKKWVDVYADKLKEMEKAEDDVANLKKALGPIQDRAGKKPTAKNLKRLKEAEEELAAANKAFAKIKSDLEKLESPEVKADMKAKATAAK